MLNSMFKIRGLCLDLKRQHFQQETIQLSSDVGLHFVFQYLLNYFDTSKPCKDLPGKDM